MPRLPWRHEMRRDSGGEQKYEDHACKSMRQVPTVLKQAVKYPLLQRLDKNKKLIKLYKGSSTERIQIVSPELCGKSARFLEPGSEIF